LSAPEAGCQDVGERQGRYDRNNHGNHKKGDQNASAPASFGMSLRHRLRLDRIPVCRLVRAVSFETRCDVQGSLLPPGLVILGGQISAFLQKPVCKCGIAVFSRGQILRLLDRFHPYAALIHVHAIERRSGPNPFRSQ